MEYVVEMLNIRKEFPGIVANDNITLQLKEGEVHALLGENGAGKSTLMGMLFGMYKPDRGCIKVRGKEVKISNPNIANDLGIGMVHQHFKLVDNFTVTENIILGCEPKKGLVVDIKTAAKRIEELSKQYGLNVFLAISSPLGADIVIFKDLPSPKVALISSPITFLIS